MSTIERQWTSIISMQVNQGRILGRPRSTPWQSPPQPPPVPQDARHSARQYDRPRTIADAVERLLAAYDSHLNTKRGKDQPISKKQWASYEQSARALLAARVGLEGYVTTTMKILRRLKGRTPYKAEVLSPKAVTAWLTHHQQQAATTSSATTTYHATNDRRQQWRDWIACASAFNRALPLER